MDRPNPSAATSSTAYGTSGSTQAGFAHHWRIAARRVWSGTAESWVDLQAMPPEVYSDSWAQGIWPSGGSVCVVGYARNTVSFQDEAIMWSCSVPEPPSLLALLGGLGLLPAFRRRR